MAIWEEPFNGRTWKQMPGGGPDEKKMNFALFRRGKLTLVDLEKWEDGETASARSMRKGIALGKAMRRLATLRAAAARREQEELQMPSGIHYEPDTNQSEERETMSTTTRQKELLQRFESAAADKPWGVKSRFMKRVPMSTATGAAFFGGRKIGDEVLDRIETALDDDSWQDGDGAGGKRSAGGGPKGKRGKRGARVVNGTPPRAHRDASAKVTIEELQEALEEHIAAKERFADLAKRYAAQLES